MATTLFLARLVGLLQLAVAAAMLTRRAAFLKVLHDIVGNQTTLFLSGILLLVSGLLIVLSHNVWTAGLLALVVTLVGWIMIARGLSCMLIPSDRFERLVAAMLVDQHCSIYGAFVLVLAVYLTWAGFTG